MMWNAAVCASRVEIDARAQIADEQRLAEVREVDPSQEPDPLNVRVVIVKLLEEDVRNVTRTKVMARYVRTER